MFETFTFRWLRWRRPDPPPLYPLPDGVERLFVDAPGGKLEILYARPRGAARPDAAPLFFVHGGMGGAWVWLEYLTFFSARGIPCYAVSMRSHGGSYYPSYLRMVYMTTMRMLAGDVVAGLRWAQEREGGRETVLVGHSSGGGLSQLLLSDGDARVKGLALVGAIPGFGSSRVYTGWMSMDPWFLPRMWFQLGHPSSPLSHPALTWNAFFSRAQSAAFVKAFHDRLTPYESFLWSLGMSKPFVNMRNVVSQIAGWDKDTSVMVKRQNLMILAGESDTLMRVPIMEDLANAYRVACAGLASQKKKPRDVGAEVIPVEGAGDRDNTGHGVRFCLVPKAGHHMQNDIPWEVGAQKLLAFYEQL
ncbi:hypothetical protein VTJ83DRAFT_6373 [Remersonia thermophila]|uniref:AB hydrolase-1 domain-containing protein n=1 Tax=Remersonia thermophila TaxID=72144 RepID=A0ABR4D4L8_9PEZI